MLAKIESILFVASKPISAKKIATVLSIDKKEVDELMQELMVKYNHKNSGISLLCNSENYQMVSNANNKEITEKFIKAESTGELTRPQLETLTVVSYCGPITKPELEQIRGVNCSIILRNLMMRSLIKEVDNGGILSSYEVTMDYLRHLGISSVTELVDYEKLHKHPYIENEKSNLENSL